MDNQTEYISAGITAAISILSVSAIYFINLANPKTLILTLAPIILLGYTAQNSQDEFKKSSLASALSLVLLPIGSLTAAVSISLTIINPLVSHFAKGKNFREYYSSTSLPLIILGLIASLLMITGSMAVPEFNNNLQNQTNTVVISHAQAASNFLSNEQDLTAVENTAESTVTITQSEVIEDVDEDLNQQEVEKVQESFETADEEVPEQVKQNIKQNDLRDSWQQRRIEESVQKFTNNFYEGNNIYSLIIISPLLFYSFQPLLGVLTALFATIISRIELE